MRHRKRSNVLLIFITVIITIIVGLSVLFVIGNTNKTGNNNIAKKEAISSTQVSSSSSITRSSSTTNTKQVVSTESSIDETNLTNEQIEKWANAIVDVYGLNNQGHPDYIMHKPELNPEDKMVYVRIEMPQMDDYGSLRINSKGEMEGIRSFNGSILHYSVISKKYMDVETPKEMINKLRSEKYNKDGKMTFKNACDVVIANVDKWVNISQEDKDKLRIISINENLSELKSDSNGEYYTVVLETNKEPQGVMLSGDQFKVYLDGSIEQRVMSLSRDEWVSIN